MSDGPYRTLNLRQQWKQLLQRAYQRAFVSQDVIDAICPALERDCAWEITKDADATRLLHGQGCRPLR
jgi:hypothetical protein